MTAKYIGETNSELKNGEIYNCVLQNMTGKIFSDFSNPDDKGVRDTRIMLWISLTYHDVYYKVFKDENEIYSYFKEL